MAAIPARAASDENRGRILAAAQALFRARGSDAVTVAEVAEQAGVARATVFNHFGSKQAVVEAITESVFEGYRSLLDAALAERSAPVPALVRRLFEQMGHGIEADRRFYRAVFREIAKITVGVEEGSIAQRARQEAIGRIETLLARGQSGGELVADFAAADLATAFDSLVFGTITHWLYDDASQALHLSMRRAAEIFLGTVERRRTSGRAPRPASRRKR